METVENKESNELELLERVFLRLGAAESDSQLEQALARFLPAVLIKISSPSKAVQAKVVELLTHVSKRLRNRPAVQLPVDKLLTQFTDTTSSTALVNVSLVYIRQGYTRLPPAQQVTLLPVLLQSLNTRTTQQDSILQLCVPALVHLEWPRDIDKRRDLLPLSDQSDVRKILLQFLLLYLLLPYGSLEVKPGQLPPPGLNRTLITRVTGGTTPSPEQLEATKIAIIKLLSSEILSSEEVICQLIVATGDPKSSVSELAERYVKQFSNGFDWENPTVIQQLYSLTLGTVATPGKRTNSSSQTVETVSGCNLRTRINIISFLLKSTLATNTFPSCIQFVFDALFGSSTTSKLRSLTLQFVHHIIHRAMDQRLSVMSPILLTGLYKIIEQPDEECNMKSMAYTGVGLLARRSPALFSKDPNHLLRLFKVLSDSTVDRDIVLAVQECMSLVAPVYRGVGDQTALLLEAAILENIYNPTHQARLMATMLASKLFPFSHTPSRFVSMVACGDSKEDVREAGKKGLILETSSEEGVNDDVTTPPSFPDMVNYVHKRATIFLTSGGYYKSAAGKLPFAPAIMTEALKFLRICLEASAGVTMEHCLATTTLVPVSSYLSALYSSSSVSIQCVDEYLDLLIQSLGPAGDLDLHSVAMLCLLQLVAATTSQQLASRLLPQILWIRGFTQSSRASVSEPAGQLVGILAGLLEEDRFLDLISNVYNDTFNKTHYVQLGAVMTLGHVTSNAVTRINARVGEEPVSMETNQQNSLEEYVKKSLMRLVNLMSDSSAGSTHLISPSVTGLGHVCQGGRLPIPSQSDDDGGRLPIPSQSDDDGLNKMELIEQIKKLLKSSLEMRIREQCAITLGRMGVYERDSAHCHTLLDALFKVRDDKGVELQFTVGEAISCVAVGQLSTALHTQWNIVQQQHYKNSSMSVDSDSDLLAWTVDTILREHAPHPLALIRQSSCVWLLCLLKHASSHPCIQDHLKRIQNVFMNLLADNNEITQEVASRGLGLTYELCDSSMRQEMVESLVSTIMEGRRIEQKVTEDTALFKQGELGKAPEGKGMSTYKELCSIASDLNKPDLIYKFMHLANHNALWNSKKGAAFSFSTIAATARQELTPHLPQLVPRLYRYKYDPTPRVQLAMSNIWSAIVPDNKKTIDKYLTAILDDLSHNLNSHLWRNRQASCMGLSDLLVGQLVSDVASYLPSLWVLCLRARDDIKETVRKAAAVACKALHKVTVRACETPTIGSKVIGEVLPFILSKGMQNPSSEVRAISLLTLLKMSENAGSLLKPHIPVLVPTLLESLSSLEHQELNTLSLQLSGETEILEKLDNIRMKASKHSPMMETIDLCIPHIDNDVLVGLIPRLIDTLKNGIGIGTKGAAAQFVVSLVQHCRNDLTPYAGKLMTSLTSNLLDRSVGVRKSSAQAIGHLVRVSKISSIKKLLDKMNKWYFEKTDLHIQVSIGEVYHSISHRSPDVANSVMADFIPLVFLAMHITPSDDDPSSKTVVKQWQETWSDAVPGEGSTIRLYLPQLVEISNTALQSQSWPMKAQGAAALATVAEKMGSSLSLEQLNSIISTLLDGLQGRTWDGKESLLHALRKVCVQMKHKTLVTTTNNTSTNMTTPTDIVTTPTDITTALLVQCRKKQNHTYQMVAIETLGGVASTLQIDVFSEFIDIATPILIPSVVVSDMSRDEDYEVSERREEVSQKLLLREKTAEALGKIWPSNKETQVVYFSDTLETISTALPLYTWRVQLALCVAVKSIFTQLSIDTVSEPDMTVIANQTIPSLCKCLNNVKYSVLRQAAVQAMDKMTATLVRTTQLSSLPQTTIHEMRESLSAMTDIQLKTLTTTLLNRIQ